MHGPWTHRDSGVLLLALLMSHWATASPHGLGSEANQGCQCHGASTDTVIQLLGVPETFAANTTYEVDLADHQLLGAIREPLARWFPPSR